ncbi:MAG: hypothetical protein MUE69_33340 [Myxococcota bacterium]|jgi:hypothetical protein|nr:hypothetical protein [Myxococcota bacterium]
MTKDSISFGLQHGKTRAIREAADAARATTDAARATGHRAEHVSLASIQLLQERRRRVEVDVAFLTALGYALEEIGVRESSSLDFFRSASTLTVAVANATANHWEIVSRHQIDHVCEFAAPGSGQVSLRSEWLGRSGVRNGALPWRIR